MNLFQRIVLILLVTITCIYIVNCQTVDGMKTEIDNRFANNALWVDQPQNSKPKAVVILLHGLNLKPAKMDGWANMLTQNGALVIRFALYGHRGFFGEMAQVKEEVWRKQFVEALEKAQELSLQHKAPIHFMGFSLGALVGLESLTHFAKSNIAIEKMVLIAPAIATPWYSHAAVSMFSWLGRGFTLPSRSPKHYRANNGTTIAAYQALFELKKSIHDKKFLNCNVPALILIDKHDELVPMEGVKKIINDNKLSHWQLEVVDNRNAYRNFGFRHLMVDEEAVGPDLWKALAKKVIHHLNLDKL